MARLPGEGDIGERTRLFKQGQREFEESMKEARAARARKEKAPPGRPPEIRWDEYIDPLIDIELERGGKNIAA